MSQLNVPTMADYMAKGETPEILFWVGCAGSFDDRAKKITKAIVKILNHVNIKFAVLGTEESCTGDPAKRAGNEFLFQMQAMQNIQVLNGYEVKKIVTGCPHCFNTIKNEYPGLGGTYEVIHHTQLIQDLIAEGKLKWNKMIAGFYKPFHKNVENTIETSDRATGERALGKDPKTKRKVIVRLGRFGPMAEIVAEKESDTPMYASLQKNQRLETVTLEEVLDLFKLPRHFGQYKNKELIVNNGRYGPYIKFGEEYISLPKEEDPFTIEIESIKAILDGPRLPRTLGQHKGLDIIINKGRFGPYIKYGTEFISLPKGEDPLEIDLETVVDILSRPRLPRNAGQYKGKDVVIAKGRFGPYIKYDDLFVALKKGDDPFEVNIDYLGELIDAKLSGVPLKKEKATKTEKASAAKKSKSKSSAKKSTTTKKKAAVSTKTKSKAKSKSGR